MYQTVHLLLTVIIGYTQCQMTDPFCSYCDCNFQSGDGMNIDCTDVDINAYLYDTHFWLDEFNSTYRVASFRGQNSNLKQLNKEFIQSTLRTLDLSNNAIGLIENGVFGKLQNMEILNLSNNSLTWIHPDVFKGMYWAGEYYPLKSMKVLNLSYNKLDALLEDTFEHVDKIEELYLRSNPLFRIEASTQVALTSLPFLKRLDLSLTDLKELPEFIFTEHRYLEHLDISENAFRHVPLALGELRNLDTLEFNSNTMRYLDVSNGFPKIQSLRILNMNYMQYLGEIRAGALGGVKFLEELSIRDNPSLTKIEAGIFATNETEFDLLPELEKLDISNNQLTYIEPGVLPDWDTLNDLKIGGNPLACDCRVEWMFEKLLENDLVDGRNISCTSPKEYQSLTFQDIKEGKAELPCYYEVKFMNTSLNKFIGTILLLNGLILIACVYCRRRRRNSIVYVSLRHV